MASNILVVCYSRSGVTLRAAMNISEALGADLERIEDCASRAGFGGYLRSALEAAAKGLPTIRTQRDPRDYDMVVLGTPVWAGTMSSPMRSYVTTHRGRLHNVALFAVMGGRGAEDTVRELQVACDALDAPTCVLSQREIDENRHQDKCADFARAVQERAQRRGMRQSTAA